MLDPTYTTLINTPSTRRFLFTQTQHRIGGFSKHPGGPPDIYHSYLGLAALAVMKEPGLKELDSALCVSREQKARIGEIRGGCGK
jgi:geranylgeranyl transferase type-1 subunit beta